LSRLPGAGEAFLMTARRLLGPEEIGRSVRRIAHEIVENNRGAEGLVLVGLLSRGYPLARRLAAAIEEFEGTPVPAGKLDIGLYRDDIGTRASAPRLRPSEIPGNIDGTTVVLVDDVLFTGRSARAAMDALLDFGRPRRVRLAVLIDRGHRELPISPDFVGKNIPTRQGEAVRVRLAEVDGEDSVYIEPGEGP
jgi:pyrimidine operon attenuation protein/uracil phosphoribosyltransferase